MTNPKTKIAYLTENELFHGIPREELAEFERTLAMTACQRGRLFYMPGETGEALFILKEGRVQLYRLSAEGKKLIIDILEPGTVFGEMTVIGQGMYETFAEALEPGLICVMSRSDVERLLQRHPHITLHLLHIVGRRLLESQKRLTELSFMDVSTRLAAQLLRLQEKGGNPIMGFSHQDLADFIGTYRETITHTLNQFKHQGIIDIQRKEIVILDPLALERISRTDEE